MASAQVVNKGIIMARPAPDLNIAAETAARAVATLFPDQSLDQSSPEYEKALQTFWNRRQQENRPQGYFKPTRASQVQAAIKEVVKAQSPFAIRGGGHSSNSIGSSSQGGFLFDLSDLNHIEVADDRKSIRLGPGVHWGPLYQVLEPQGLICLGGRDFGVGVPGFIFGGGLSFFTSNYGWAVDNILSVDIVLADGSLITADAQSHPDLFRALKGGGAHNFGIVTNLTLKLYPYKGAWGGMQIVTEANFDKAFKAYDDYIKEHLNNEPNAHVMMDFGRREGELVTCFILAYMESKSDPPIFNGFRSVPSEASSFRLANISDLATEIAVGQDCRGRRNQYWTHTLVYDAALLQAVVRYWAERTKHYSNKYRFALSLNLVPLEMRNRATREGQPNVYGLDGSSTMINMLFTCTWNDASDDESVTALLRSFTREAVALEERHGRHHPFLYMNYAHAEQDVIASFGAKNQAYLQKVSAKYDPTGVFQRLQPGAFKLGTVTTEQPNL